MVVCEHQLEVVVRQRQHHEPEQRRPCELKGRRTFALHDLLDGGLLVRPVEHTQVMKLERRVDRPVHALHRPRGVAEIEARSKDDMGVHHGLNRRSELLGVHGVGDAVAENDVVHAGAWRQLLVEYHPGLKRRHRVGVLDVVRPG